MAEILPIRHKILNNQSARALFAIHKITTTAAIKLLWVPEHKRRSVVGGPNFTTVTTVSSFFGAEQKS